jgi:hypothetical protein
MRLLKTASLGDDAAPPAASWKAYVRPASPLLWERFGTPTRSVHRLTDVTVHERPFGRHFEDFEVGHGDTIYAESTVLDKIESKSKPKREAAKARLRPYTTPEE